MPGFIAIGDIGAQVGIEMVVGAFEGISCVPLGAAVGVEESIGAPTLARRNGDGPVVGDEIGVTRAGDRIDHAQDGAREVSALIAVEAKLIDENAQIWAERGHEEAWNFVFGEGVFDLRIECDFARHGEDEFVVFVDFEDDVTRGIAFDMSRDL